MGILESFLVGGIHVDFILERDMPSVISTTVTHWLPIVTFCPVNNLPDLLYVEVTFTEFEELYAVRKKVRSALRYRKLYMEQACQTVYNLFPNCTSVTVRLPFNKHKVTITNKE